MKNVVAIIITLSLLVATGLVVTAEVPTKLQDNDYDIGLVPPTPEGKAETLVVYGAKWCGPCQLMKPLWAKLKKEGYKDHYVDIDNPDPKVPEIHRNKRPQSVPTIEFWQNGKKVKTIVGITTEHKIKQTLWKP